MTNMPARNELFVPQAIIPTVIESGPRGERAFDIYSLLLRERIVFLNTPINDRVANTIIAQLLFWNARTQTATSTSISPAPAA